MRTILLEIFAIRQLGGDAWILLAPGGAWASDGDCRSLAAIGLSALAGLMISLGAAPNSEG